MHTRVYHILLCTCCLLIGFISIGQDDGILKPPSRTNESAEEEKVDTLPPPSANYTLSVDQLDCIVKRISDSSFYDAKTSVIEMYGNARIDYCDLVLEADQINYNTETGIAEAFGKRDSLGNVIEYSKFTDAGQEFLYHDFTFNFETRKGIIHELVTQQGEGFLRGGTVKKISDTESFIKGAIYTTCNLEHPHYFFTFDKSKFKTKKYAAGKNMNLYIKDIPTPIYFPFGIFPLETGKRAGFTRISPGYDRQRGFEVGNLGWYQPINDNMDAIVTSNVYTTGSWDALVGFRYDKRYKHSMNLDFRYTKLQGFDVNDVLGGSVNNSFQIDYRFNQDPKVWPTANLNASISLGQQNFRELNVVNPQDRLNATYTSSVNFNKQFRNTPISMTSNMRYNQNIQTNAVSLSLPNVNVSTSTISPFRGISKPGKSSPLETLTFSYNSTYQNQINTVDSIFFGNPIGQLADGRFGATHRIPVSLNVKLLKYINFSPSVNYNESWTGETIRRTWNADSLRVEEETIREFRSARWYTPSVGLNTNIYGMKQFKKGRLQAIRHVMRPSISFGYQPDFTRNENIFREVQVDSTGTMQQYSIFQGAIVNGPPANSGGSIGFNLGNNLEMKVLSKKDSTEVKKIKIFENLNFNTSYNLAADSLNLQPVSFTANTRLFDKVQLNFNGRLDPYQVDETTGRRINEFRFGNGGLAELTNFSFRASGNFNSKDSDNEVDNAVQLIENPLFPGEQLFVDNYFSNYVDFNIPWNLSWNYNFTYGLNYGPNTRDTNIQNAVSGRVDFSVTDNWRMDISSGYDFTDNAVNFTNIAIRRDLHCWQMSFDWSPVGTFQRYMFTIAPKSSLLRDVKLEKRRTIFDNNQP